MLVQNNFLTVNRVALVVVESSGNAFFPVNVFFKCFLTSLLNIQWKKKMNRPWIVTREEKDKRMCVILSVMINEVIG